MDVPSPANVQTDMVDGARGTAITPEDEVTGLEAADVVHQVSLGANQVELTLRAMRDTIADLGVRIAREAGAVEGVGAGCSPHVGLADLRESDIDNAGGRIAGVGVAVVVGLLNGLAGLVVIALLLLVL